MKRRSFFAVLFGGLLARFLPKPRVFRIEDAGLSPQYWHITELDNVKFEGCVAKAIDPSKPCSLTVVYETVRGYYTAPIQPAIPWRPPQMPRWAERSVLL